MINTCIFSHSTRIQNWNRFENNECASIQGNEKDCIIIKIALLQLFEMRDKWWHIKWTNSSSPILTQQFHIKLMPCWLVSLNSRIEPNRNKENELTEQTHGVDRGNPWRLYFMERRVFCLEIAANTKSWKWANWTRLWWYSIQEHWYFVHVKCHPMQRMWMFLSFNGT